MGVALTSVLVFGVSVSLGFTSSPRSHIPSQVVTHATTTKTAVEPIISLESHPMDEILALADYHPQNGASPLEKNICEEQRQFELKLGKALDTLRKDYPKILTEDPGTYRILSSNFSNFQNFTTRDSHSFQSFYSIFGSPQITRYIITILKSLIHRV